jgi:hypothetical protein
MLGVRIRPILSHEPLPWIFGEDTCVTSEKFWQVEDQKDTWQQAEKWGREIAQRLKQHVLM